MPSGCWCEGVTKARRKRGQPLRASSTRRPCASTDEVEGLLRAGNHEHLVGVAFDAAVAAQVRGDGASQRGMPIGVAIAHHVAARTAPVLGRKPRPLRHGKGVEGRQRGGEGARHRGQPRALAEALDRARHGVREPRRRRQWTRLAQRLRRRGTVRSAGPRPLGLERARHVGARAHARLDQPLGGEALEGLDDGGARHAQLARQRARRRQALARGDAAVEHQLAQAQVELGGDGARRGVVDRHRQQQRPARPLDHRTFRPSRLARAGNGITELSKWTFVADHSGADDRHAVIPAATSSPRKRGPTSSRRTRRTVYTSSPRKRGPSP